MKETKPTYKKQGNIGLASGDKVPDENQQMAGDHQQEELETAREGGTSVRVHGGVPSRNVQPSVRFCAERGLQHPDEPGLQPVPVRTSDTT